MSGTSELATAEVAVSDPLALLNGKVAEHISAAEPENANAQAERDTIRKDAVHHELSQTDSSLKDLLIDDASGTLFDSISWLLMNSGSLDFSSENPDSSIFVSMKASSDALEQSLLSSSMQAIINQDITVSAGWNSWSFDQMGNMSGSGSVSNTSGPTEVIVSSARDDDDDDDSDTISDSKSSDTRKRAGSPLLRGDGAPKKKRQRERIQDLEDKAKQLMAENAELRSHLNDLSTRAVDMERQKAEMLNTMSEKVANGDSGSPELVSMLKRYGELFAEYGTCRQKEVSFHLSQLRRLLLPTQTTKMCMWTLQQDKTFYQSSTSALWNILSKELGLAPEQAAKIQTHRKRVLELLEKLQESLDLADSLQDAIEKRHSVFESCLTALQSIISPRQTVQFLLWVRRFGHLLPQYIPTMTTKAPSDFPAVSSSHEPNHGSEVS